MARLTDENMAIAHEIIGRYPVRKSAVIPLCHLAQEQDGHLTDDAMEHIAELTGVSAAEILGIKEGATTPDGVFSLEGYECQAACTEAPCLQVNYRYFHNVTTADFDRLVDDLRAGRRADEIPPHGTLARTRQQIPADRAAGPADPAGAGPPVWLRDEPALQATKAAKTKKAKA
jgi:NADH-quinone oxidoreductase subunit E